MREVQPDYFTTAMTHTKVSILEEEAAAAASAFEDIKQKFTNQRQWREFVSAVQCSVNYPAAINSLRSGTKWFSDGLAQASSCLARTLRGQGV